ncbi:hypothetical protein [Rhizobium leguminosarum]|uniref:hypothetical protein n=1 Tax=Rhizobium leguminosarum TaxID=384 RepID=UPI00144197F4|nr:hypothetical protein [Rhizobium leguminosarum]NKK78926.1 hypothetical protein [Rhizobium leguminosarum bv. viciae]NKL09364.1 hypothetical protein [Rhizobium leguminosarum bv. viciae]NKL88254.1 hypothetical protein [Rhizobium leguminosarum bv. viciae]NKL94862.1 hypothetical protein [Rhizobium leguminosarum bv. viciae]NKM95452.1 hypothetical protein [Rhizobium leguminosarum bv. viciae]
MLFGQSVFQSVLERLKAEDETDEDAGAPTVHRVSGLGTGLAFDVMAFDVMALDVMEGISAASQRVGQAYFDNLDLDAAAAIAEEPATAPPPEPVMPDHLARIAPEEIAAELAIAAADTQQTLNEKRRAFAKANHPDGVAELFRDNANRRMMIANLLIDEAMRRLPHS